jgi:hypothetical protein
MIVAGLNNNHLAILNPNEDFKVVDTISVEQNLTKAKSFKELPDALVIAFTTVN